MFVLIKNKITNEYHTIYRKDINRFLNLKNFFDLKDENGELVFNFEVITDTDEIKKILDEKFTSKGRGEDYNENLPSSTKMVSLAPLDINNDKFLIRFWNNTPLSQQIKDKEITLQKGSWIHKILELWITDKEGRSKDKPLIEKIKLLKNVKKKSINLYDSIDKKILSDIRRYIKIAYESPDIINKIPNIQDIKEELEYLAIKCLPEFIKNELIFTDLVYSEIFLCEDDFVQGSIDLCCYDNNTFAIWDFKTTSTVNKQTGKPKFKSDSPEQLKSYAIQLYIYNELLKKSNMTHILGEQMPNFYIIQIHLINGKYKKFTIPKGLVESQGKKIEKVLKWYWDIRNGNYIPEENEENQEDSELSYLTL